MGERAQIHEDEISKPEAWLDQERERLYKELIDDIQKAAESGKSGGQYLAQLVEKNAQDYGTKVTFRNWFKPEDYEKVEFFLLRSASLDAVAGTAVERPLFVVKDEKIYRRLEAMFDLEAGGSHGVHFSPGFFDNKTPWGKVGLIITKDREVTAIHEMRHSVDPFLTHGSDKRTNYNRAVSELFAFYKEYILDNEKPDWDGLANRVSSYHTNYSNLTPKEEKKSTEQFSHSIRMAVKGLQKLRQKSGDIQTQRRLIQSKTLSELIAILAQE